MDSPYRRELEAAISAAEIAAQISRTTLAAASSDSTSAFDLVKDDLSPVTVADFAIQALLTRTLGLAFSSDGFIGEESADELRQNPALLTAVLDILVQVTGNAALFRDGADLCDVIDSCATVTPSTARRVWVFDPIDGTKTFIRHEQYAVNIALLDGGREVLSVVACPLMAEDVKAPVRDGSVDPTGRGCILFGVRGHGAYVRPLLVGEKGVEVQPRRLPRHCDRVTTRDGLRSVTCWELLDSGVDVVHKDVADRLGVEFPGSDLLGWVPRWAVMALGAANMTVWVYKQRNRYAKVWDHAGAMLLFEEVGGKVTDVHGKDIDFKAGRKFENNFGFVAAPEKVHHLVLEAVQGTLKAKGREDLMG